MALTDEQKMQIIKEATASGYKGSFQELFDQQEAAMAPQQSAQPMQQMPEQPMEPPMQTGDMPSMQQMQDGDLVQSYASEAPGIGNMPMGEDVGTILESASTYKEGGFKGIRYADKYSNGGYKGYKQKYQNAGFKLPPLGSTNLDVRGLMNQELNNQNTSLDTNPATAVQQNNVVTENLNTQNKKLYDQTISNINTKKANNEQLNASEMAVIQAGPNAQFDTKNTIKKVTDMQTASLPENQGEFRDVVKDNMRDAMASSFLTSQIAGGYGRDYVNQSLQDQNNFEEKYDNLLSGTGQKTMQQIAMGVTGGGSGAFKYAPKLKNALKFDPSSTFGSAYNLPKQIIQNKSFIRGLRNYRQGLKGTSKLGTTGNVLKETVGAVHTLAIPSYLKDVANVKEDALQGGLSATELVKVANPYLSLAVNATKATKDFQKGDYTSGALRIGSTLTDKYLPKSFVAKVLDPEQTKSLTTIGTKTFDLFRKTPSNLKKTGIIPTDKED